MRASFSPYTITIRALQTRESPRKTPDCARTGKVWFSGGCFTKDGKAFIGFGDDKCVTVFDMSSDEQTIVVQREDGIAGALLSTGTGQQQQLCLNDEGGALVMYDLDKLLECRGKAYSKAAEKDARLWEQTVPKGFEQGRGHQKRHHNCTCDACGGLHSNLAASLPGLAKFYGAELKYEGRSEARTPFSTSCAHNCGCGACDDTLHKIEGRLEVIKEASKKGFDFFQRAFDERIKLRDGGGSGSFGDICVKQHGCGCEACALTLEKLQSDVQALKGHLGDTPLTAAVCYMGYSEDGTMLIVVNKERLKAEVRDATTGVLVHVIDYQMADSGNGWGVTGSSALSFSPGNMALAGSKACESVRIYKMPEVSVHHRILTQEFLKEEITLLKEIKLREGMNATNVALHPGFVDREGHKDGRQVAIGAADGTVWLMSTDPDDNPAGLDELRPAPKSRDREIHPPTDSGKGVVSLAYSHDGMSLAVGWDGGECIVYDVHTTAPLASFQHDSLYGGLVLEFAPKDDVLAFGGGMSGCAVFHALRPSAAERFRATASGGFSLGLHVYPTLHASWITDDCVILVHDRWLEVQNRSQDINIDNKGPTPSNRWMPDLDNTLAKVELQDQVEADNFPIASNGEQVACVRQRSQIVSVRGIKTGPPGEVLFQLGPLDGAIRGVKYSPDGTLLMVFGGWGLTIYNTKDGKIYNNTKDGFYVNNAAIDSQSRWLATTGDAGTGYIFDLKTMEVLHDLESQESVQGLTFDDDGKRLAYLVMGGQQVVILKCPEHPKDWKDETDDKKWQEISRFPVRDWAWSMVTFSPGTYGGIP